MKVFFHKNRYSIFFTTFIVECCNCLFRCNQTCYCAGMVSVTLSKSIKSRPLTAEVDSRELADVHAD